MPLASIWPFGNRQTLIQILTGLGLTTNLKLCLDAGDQNSYTSGQKWLDTSGNGYDFFLGATSGSEASDPTFNGTPGGRTSAEYWSFDGGDFFTYDTSNETWMHNLHKDNAAFTYITWIYPADLATEHNLFATLTNDTTDTGVGVYFFQVGPGESTINLRVRNAGAEGIGVGSSSEVPTGILKSGWNFASMSLDEAVGASGIFYHCNGTTTVEDEASTYTSPASGNSTSTMTIGTGDGGPFPSGVRLAMLAIWEGAALSSTNLAAIFNATRNRFEG